MFTGPRRGNNNLEIIRLEEGLTRTELARLSRLTVNTIRKLEEDEDHNAREVTKRKVVRGLNSNPNRIRDYTFEEAFPLG